MRFLTLLLVLCSSVCFAVPPIGIKNSVEALPEGRGSKAVSEYFRGTTLILTRTETRDTSGATVIIVHSIKLHGKPVFTTAKHHNQHDRFFIPNGRVTEVDLDGDGLTDLILVYDDSTPQSYAEAFWVAPNLEIRPISSEALTLPEGKLIPEELLIEKATADPKSFQK